MQGINSQRVMKINLTWDFGKTKPIKANNQSSLITNHLVGKPNQTQNNQLSIIDNQLLVPFNYQIDVIYHSLFSTGQVIVFDLQLEGI